MVWMEKVNGVWQEVPSPEDPNQTLASMDLDLSELSELDNYDRDEKEYEPVSQASNVLFSRLSPLPISIFLLQFVSSSKKKLCLTDLFFIR